MLCPTRIRVFEMKDWGSNMILETIKKVGSNKWVGIAAATLVGCACGYLLHVILTAKELDEPKELPDVNDIISVIDFEMEKGTLYTGQILQGRRHGWGVLKTATNNLYEGVWTQNRLPYGTMKIWNTDKQQYTKIWEGGLNQDFEAHGFGKMIYGCDSDSVYIGNYKHNYRDGLGRIWNGDRQHFCRWKGGLKVEDDRLYTTGDSVYGVDVSKWQEGINWDELAIFCDRQGLVYTVKTDSTIYVHPVDFVFIKATQGTDIQDPFYLSHVQQARKHYIKMGSYHVLVLEPTKESIKAQIENFTRHLQMEKHDLPPMLDLEKDKLEKWQKELRMSDDEVQDYILQWLEGFEEATGMKPIIYGSENYWDEHLKKREFEDYTHWIAHYPKDDSLKNNKKAVVRPKRQAWTFWQMTEKAFAGGVNIDIDKFNGSYKEFKLKYE